VSRVCTYCIVSVVSSSKGCGPVRNITLEGSPLGVCALCDVTSHYRLSYNPVPATSAPAISAGPVCCCYLGVDIIDYHRTLRGVCVSFFSGSLFRVTTYVIVGGKWWWHLL
jgi:hypothetical protein